MTDRDPNAKHYGAGGIETIDFIRAKLTPEEYIGYLKGNILKYVSRMAHKGCAESDASKAAFYARWLDEAMKAREAPRCRTCGELMAYRWNEGLYICEYSGCA